MRALILAVAAVFFSQIATAPRTISIPTEDGGVVFADLYGKSDRAVVLAHGGQFNKESWAKQAQTLAAAGFQVLALDFRGYGKSRGPGDSVPMNAPLHLDVLAGVRYLRENGAKNVSVVGGSMGGGAAADASIASQPGEIDRLVLLGASPNGPAKQLKSPILFIVARDDANDDGPRLPRIREQYEKSPQPKELIILDGSAHAQFLFQTDQADRVMREILRFLSAKSTAPQRLNKLAKPEGYGCDSLIHPSRLVIATRYFFLQFRSAYPEHCASCRTAKLSACAAEGSLFDLSR